MSELKNCPFGYFVSGPSAFATIAGSPSQVEEWISATCAANGDDTDEYTATPLYTSPLASLTDDEWKELYDWLRDSPDIAAAARAWLEGRSKI